MKGKNKKKRIAQECWPTYGEYLRQLYGSLEWEFFITHSRILMKENGIISTNRPFGIPFQIKIWASPRRVGHPQAKRKSSQVDSQKRWGNIWNPSPESLIPLGGRTIRPSWHLWLLWPLPRKGNFTSLQFPHSKPFARFSIFLLKNKIALVSRDITN